MQNGAHRIGGRLSAKQGGTRETLKEQDTERPDVGAFVERTSSGLFGAHVSGRAQDDAGSGVIGGDGR